MVVAYSQTKDCKEIFIFKKILMILHEYILFVPSLDRGSLNLLNIIIGWLKTSLCPSLFHFIPTSSSHGPHLIPGKQ